MKSTGNSVLYHSLFTLETLSDINCLPERAVLRSVYYIENVLADCLHFFGV